MTTILLGRVCRTCLKKSNDMHKLREFIENDLQIEDMLNQSIPSFDLKMDDVPLPVEICVECFRILQKTYDFVQMCWKSNQELKNILNQQEQEIEASMVGVTADVNPKDILEETDILMDNFKIEPYDDNSICSSPKRLVNDTQVTRQDYQFKGVKLEVEMINESQHEDSSSSVDYWPNNSKEDSESNSSKNMSKALDIKSKRNGCRKRSSTNICLHCNKSFAKKKYLSKHLLVHDPVYEFVCDICSYRFSSERKLRNHIQDDHTDKQTCLDDGPYACPDCPIIFQQKLELTVHRAMHREKTFKCQECNMSLKTLTDVNTHMSSKHPDVLPFKCHVCEKAFRLENQLKYHINEHMGYKNLKCDLCIKSRSSFSFSFTHSGEKPHMCKFCDRAYASSGDLVKHLRTHVGEKTYFCDQCPEAFKYATDLKDHKLLHYKEQLNLQQNNNETAELSNETKNTVVTP
ncbi:myoneurin-like [Calliphora vicina]|uniref:myoneurin-like n=1 Tax=Calliphora vicina TaxID=7373 RepID=UPI00325BC63C